jgi:adenine-specific DNA-methyltransferase
MKDIEGGSVSLILTDPPYLVNYRDRSGRQVRNDDNDHWMEPAFAQMHRVLKDGGTCLSFYAWNRVDRFVDAWHKAGFHIAGHVVFTKKYASGERFTRYQHEQAYLLTKGRAMAPRSPQPDVFLRTYTGNRLHPTQKITTMTIATITTTMSTTTTTSRTSTTIMTAMTIMMTIIKTPA